MEKRENESVLIKDLMQIFINNSNLKKGIRQVAIQKAWTEQMGKGVVTYTQSVSLQNQTLIVQLSSSVLREELHHGKQKIIKMLNEAVGEELIIKLLLV